MFGRIFAASLTVALGAGLIFGSAETFAKPAGLSAKSQGLVARHAYPFRRSIPARSVFLPPIVPPFSVPNVSVAAPRVLRPIVGYRRAFGYGLPAAGIGVYYGSDSIPSDDLARYLQFPFATSTSQSVMNPDERIRYADFRRRCGSEVHIVPSEDGGERSITIRRC